MEKTFKTLEQCRNEVAQNYIKDPEYQEYYKNWDDMFDDMDNGNAINFVGRAIHEAMELHASQYKSALSEREGLIRELQGCLIDLTAWYGIHIDEIEEKSTLHEIAKKAQKLLS